MSKKILVCPNPKCKRVIPKGSPNSCPYCGTAISPIKEDFELSYTSNSTDVYDEDNYKEDNYETDDYEEDDYEEDDYEADAYEVDDYSNSYDEADFANAGNNRFADEEEYFEGEENEHEESFSDFVGSEQEEDEKYNDKSKAFASSKNEKSFVKTSAPSALRDTESGLYKDGLTGLYTRESLKELLRSVTPENMAIVSVIINKYNDIYECLGKNCGEKMLLQISYKMQTFFPDSCCRFTDNRIIVVCHDVSEHFVRKRIEIITRELTEMSEEDVDGIDYGISCGIAFGDGKMSKQDVLRLAGSLMMKKYQIVSARQSEKAVHSSTAYNPNHDHYYDDVLPEILDEVNRIPMEQIFKAVCSVVLLISIIVYLIFFL